MTGKPIPSAYTPVRYLDELQEVLHTLKVILDRHKVPFWLAEGTCLGAVRDKGVIPWHTDVDLGVVMPMPDDPFPKEIAYDALECGLVVAWNPRRANDRWGTFSVLGSKGKYDCWVLNREGENTPPRVEIREFSLQFYHTDCVSMYTAEGLSLRAGLFKKLKRIRFLDGVYCVPNPPEEYLCLCYGRDWRTPKKEGWEDDWKSNP